MEVGVAKEAIAMGRGMRAGVWRARLLRVLTLAAVLGPMGAASAQDGEGSGEAPEATEAEGDEGLDRQTRMIIAGTAVGGVYAAAGTWAYFAWYANQKQSDEFLIRDEGWFGPNTYAGGADKLGHMYSNYIAARGASQLLQYGGFKPLPATLIANGLTLAFFTGIEVKDAYHAGFGFSYGDMVANGVGNGLALAFETVPTLDRMFSFRFEYTPSAEYIDLVRETGTVDAAEDYSGQRFLLSYHLASIDPLMASRGWRWMRFVDVTAGYYTRGFLPEPKDELATKARRLFMGISLNVQQVVDEVFFDSPHGPAYGASHFATEVLAVPLTTIDLVGVESVTE
ncbi:MAG: hypothetical protein CMH57_11650 [Myxococcales bacterium]|nr:hypothetical protein [Myxococcales bacterium]